jgi:lactate permease
VPDFSSIYRSEGFVTWTQSYFPIGGSIGLSALVAAIPVVVLLGALGFLHIKAHWAAILGLACALAIGIVVYGMPANMAFVAAFNGALYGLFPIGWIVLNAIFVYDLTVATGKFEVVKQTIAGLASDRRVQLLLIGFSFGAFIEGASGFGTPVAICAAMLIGLGFAPLPAAGLALIGNTAPVAFGALAAPVYGLQRVTGLPMQQLSSMIGRQLPFFSLIVPFWLIVAMAGWQGMIEVWPMCFVAGLFFAIPQFLVSNFIGPELVDIISALVSIAASYVFLKFWQPKKIWRFPGESHAAETVRPSTRDAFIAWMPWIILSVFVFCWGFAPIKDFFNGIPKKGYTWGNITNPTWQMPGLHNMVFRGPPVADKPAAESATFSLNWLSATGTGLMLSGIVSGLLLGLSPGKLVGIYLKTIGRVKYSLLTIAAMLALGFTTRYAGSDATMGLAFASTGAAFPFFSPLLGWLGVALTGSDTASNVLFGNLQQITAGRVGISPVLAAAANSSGGVMGKMIDAQSIVVAGVATGQQGGEGAILRFVFFHSLVLACLVGVLVFLQAHYFTWMIPH